MPEAEPVACANMQESTQNASVGQVSNSARTGKRLRNEESKESRGTRNQASRAKGRGRIAPEVEAPGEEEEVPSAKVQKKGKGRGRPKVGKKAGAGTAQQ